MRARARALRARGHNIRSVARTLSLPYTTVWHWCVDRPEPVMPASAVRCFRCRPERKSPTDPAAYAYLLGQYLGDGHLVTSDRVPVLRIYCADAWPNLIDACDNAMRGVGQQGAADPEYVYPRYMFSNRSTDIMELCQ